jgi:hypothetical protein
VRFIVHEAALNGDDVVLVLIDRLVDRLADEVHLLEIPGADLLQGSGWYGAARPTRKKVLLNALAKPPRVANDHRGPHVRTYEVFDHSSAKLADRLAHTPLKIIVEDRESDGVFLDIVVEELGWQSLRELWVKSKAVTPRAVESVTASGKDAMPQRITREAADAKKADIPLRLFVLLDCDARWPGDDRAAKNLTAVNEICAQHKVSFHVLKKRCIENYIPDAVFEAVREDPRNANHVGRFNALMQRSRAQRDHFPVKDGLTESERSEAIQAGLYGPAELEDLKHLERPLLPKKPRPFLLLEEERRTFFTAEGLRERDGEGELDELLLAIAAEL